MGEAGESAGAQAERKRERADELDARAVALRAEADALETKATALRRDASNWEAGERGEAAVAEALSALPELGWTVLHDRRKSAKSRGNIDHIVVGPPGVFVIDAKNWSGRLDINEQGVFCGGRPRRQETAAVHEMAAALRRELAADGVVIPVYGVVALVQPTRTALPKVVEGVTFVAADSMVSNMVSLPARTDSVTVSRAAFKVGLARPSYQGPAVGGPPSSVVRVPAWSKGHATRRASGSPSPRKNLTKREQRAAEARERARVQAITAVIVGLIMLLFGSRIVKAVLPQVPTPPPPAVQQTPTPRR